MYTVSVYAGTPLFFIEIMVISWASSPRAPISIHYYFINYKIIRPGCVLGRRPFFLFCIEMLELILNSHITWDSMLWSKEHVRQPLISASPPLHILAILLDGAIQNFGLKLKKKPIVKMAIEIFMALIKTWVFFCQLFYALWRPFHLAFTVWKWG